MTYQVRKNQAEDLVNGQTRVFGKCQVTGELYECIVPTSGIRQLESGILVQTAFPKLSLDNREFIISGISPLGWERMFGLTIQLGK